VTPEDIDRIRLADVLPEPLSHYTDAVRGGNTLWISGMLAFDVDGSIVGVGDVVAQTEQIFRHLERALSHCNIGFENVTKVVVYLTDIAARPAINEVRKRYFGDARPASTLVEVSALAHPDALLEIEAVAHVPTKHLLAR
jgi:enamine deaminase RidA (YjgF/YER057c/UK114 family)